MVLTRLTQKINKDIYEPICSCDQNWVKFPSVVFEIWYSQGFRVITCCDFDDWPFDLISVSHALIHTSPNLGEISQIFTKLLIHCFPSHCLLWPWPLIPKANQHYETKYICVQHWMKLPSLVCAVWCRPPNVTLTFDLTT